LQEKWLSDRKNSSLQKSWNGSRGLEVPHAHVHLIPLNEMDEMRFQNKVSLSSEEFEALANNIKAIYFMKGKTQ
jgi:diadenosine tetraphosphate (Ap4A) HIT family hydrolase